MDALAAEGAPALDITTSFVPGVNPSPLERLPEGTVATSMFAHSSTPETQAKGRFRHMPLSYAGFARLLSEELTFDTCVVHVAPPGANGRCSLGAAVEFTPAAMARSRRVVAVINPRMPSLPGAESLALDDIDIVVECEAPLRIYDVGAPSGEALAVANHVAAFIEDRATLQIGLGKVPDALLRMLTSRRGLRLHSGMLSDGVMALEAAGALDRDWTHTSCVHVGGEAYYAWLDGRPDFAVRSCSHTHAAAALASLPGFVAVNSALSVDLFGQANLEMVDGRMVSGAGGAPDFARGARLSRGGVSIIALPSTSRRGDISRIAPVLDGLCTISRSDVDVVVTEHGAADLRNCSVMERATRILAVAAPQHRESLEVAFRKIAGKF
jgi:acyl-CoA hydrolase